MIGELYTAIAPAIPVAALLLSLLSLMVSMRNRADQGRALLLSKKTALITTLAERPAILGQLALIYIQKKGILLKALDAARDAGELKRIDSNLTLVLEAKQSGQDWLFRTHRTEPVDLADLESMLATANDALAHDADELTKEQAGLSDLKT